jgi:hypothetical protein
MKVIHKVQRITFSGSQMKMIVDGKDIAINLTKISKRLLKASIKERETYEVSPSGYGIHWPLIDEDLSVDALLGNAKKYPLVYA